jgi:hypothetical protein
VIGSGSAIIERITSRCARQSKGEFAAFGTNPANAPFSATLARDKLISKA